MKKEIVPPKAKKIAKNLEFHGDVRVDNYYWMNNRDDAEVIDYLNQENEYNQKMTAHTKDFQQRLFEEMKARIKEDDESVPYKLNGYWYLTRFETGKDYPIYSRKKGELEAAEELLFDVNEMAEGFEYYSLGGLNVSPDNKMVAFGVDTLSRRKYTIQIKDLQTGEIYPDKIENATGGSTWAADNKTLFYTKKDDQTLRSYRIYKHILGTDSAEDELVFEEEDETFNTYVYKSKSKEYIIIGSHSTLTTEYRILKADDPSGEFKVFQPRERGLEYSIAHYEGDFYVMTNKDKAKNFRLMKTPVEKTTQENWVDVIPHREDYLLEDVDIFKKYLVVSERHNGLNKIKVIRWDNSEEYYIPFDNETYTAYTSINPSFETDILRFTYNSMTTPTSVVDFNMETREKTVLKEQAVLDEKFDKNNYLSERIWATAKDGTKIPVSLVYKKGTKLDGNSPLLQYAYGSYGSTIDPYFSTVRLSLLDRGFIYAIAHIRGGEYLGRNWYEDGKLFNKMNTFTDYIDVSEYLIQEKYTSAEHLYAMGGSAGGLLMGAVINMAPQLYRGVISAVPFVDVVTTMLDDSIPLTTGEYDEWGNPNNKDYYEYMMQYSPYDNVVAQDYPNMLVTTGLHDSQVQYWEPAKWVAKLRELKTDNNLLLFHTNMDAGHGGASGRFEALKEVAEEYAFLLDLEGIDH
ncbi:S9 family peptidase [Salegentibacter salarius]|uniref:Proline-specific endopeptidase n=1 Tax=Salegentibacter salarius TaxID=435906 RepID=A0A2N0TSQ0_9FLAO|nr:S9 family peptidase [Salegentibacter salarius]OEY71984.1 oligopeptidase B [Salegentibacter salarius]PKD17761.1 protease 2 [Salegentibacter salarius]SLK05394.1 oligopeptidase B [Salegentibacter salarius]